jgi:hypothetical protein
MLLQMLRFFSLCFLFIRFLAIGFFSVIRMLPVKFRGLSIDESPMIFWQTAHLAPKSGQILSAAAMPMPNFDASAGRYRASPLNL